MTLVILVWSLMVIVHAEILLPTPGETVRVHSVSYLHLCYVVPPQGLVLIVIAQNHRSGKYLKLSN